jgi:ABC-type Fe3+-hydroxamate transport system substrate-binding protein
MASSPRVVSLVPSFTETLLAWGCEPVACTLYCEQPDLAHVGGTKNPDIDAIERLGPDVVLMDREENRREDAEALTARGLRIFVTDVRSVADVAPTLDRLADALGLVRRTGEWPAVSVPALEQRAFVPIWRRPWMTIGARTYGSSMLDAIGIVNVYGDDARDYPEVDLQDVVARAPDVVLVPSEPYDFKPSHLDELRLLAPVVEIDGRDLFWWGARTPAALVRLRAGLHWPGLH